MADELVNGKGADTAASGAAEPAVQLLPPAQSLPPFEGFTSRPPALTGTSATAGTAESAVPPAMEPARVAPGDGAPAWGPPPGYATPGYGAPGYATPGWGMPPGYATPAWPGYPPPPYGQFAWAQPGFAPVAYGPAPGYSWGGIGVRFGALMLDAVFVFCTLIAAGMVMSAIDGGRSTPSPAATAVSLIWLFFFISYHPACWYIFNCTLGQKALGLRVLRQADGQSLGFGAVTVRYIIFCVETIAFPLGIIAGAMAAEDPMKRSWHDEAARSVVVGRA